MSQDTEQQTLDDGLAAEHREHVGDRFVLQPGLVRYAVELPIMLLAASEFTSTMGQIAPTLGGTVSGIVWVVALLYGGALLLRVYEQYQTDVDETEILDAYGDFQDESGGKTVLSPFVAGVVIGLLLTAFAWNPAFDHAAGFVAGVLAAQTASVPSMPPLGGFLLWGGLLLLGIELTARCADVVAVSYWSKKLNEERRA